MDLGNETSIVIDADNHKMKSIITNLIDVLFARRTGKKIRIDPDHLPGLRAPKPMPKLPKLPDVEKDRQISIRAHYSKFKEISYQRPDSVNKKGWH